MGVVLEIYRRQQYEEGWLKSWKEAQPESLVERRLEVEAMKAYKRYHSKYGWNIKQGSKASWHVGWEEGRRAVREERRHDREAVKTDRRHDDRQDWKEGWAEGHRTGREESRAEIETLRKQRDEARAEVKALQEEGRTEIAALWKRVKKLESRNGDK